MPRKYLVVLRCAAIVAGVALGFFNYHLAPSAHSYGEAQIGGAFTLTDTHGKTVHDSDFKGKPLLVYMGFTNCPDICPLTLATISQTLTLLGKDASHVNAVFITLDPERDTPEVLGKYLSNFSPQIIGLTGSKEAIASVAKTYKAYYAKVTPQGAEGYLIDHSGFIYLMDREGKYVTHFDARVKAETLADAIKKIL